MEEVRSVHLQRNLGDVLTGAEREPMVLVNRGQPRLVMMSAAEFRRLKQAAGEVVPEAALRRVRHVLRPASGAGDALGFDTSHRTRCAADMAEAVLSGRLEGAISAEAGRSAAVLRAVGLLPGASKKATSR